jgi:hypothetical protein
MKRLNRFITEKEVETSEPHVATREGEGKDDKAYFKLMDKYKQERKKGDGRDALKYLHQAQALSKNGDVSRDAMLGAAYL